MSNKHEFKNEEVTVNWDPDVCIHSGNCVKGLPAVFKPGEKPWIRVDEASAKRIRETIDNCPSGALSYNK